VLAIEPVLRAERLTGLLGTAGGVGFAGFVWGVARGRSWAVPWAVVVLGGAYAASLFLPEREVDRSAPLMAATFVLLAELAYWTLELRAPLSPEPGMLERRMALIAVTTIGGFILASVALAATAVPVGGGVLGDLLGVAAAIGALTIVAWLAQRGRQSST
jgi:hypothetical protein